MTVCAVPTFAGTSEATDSTATHTATSRSVVLTERLEQIKEMDLKSLTNAEKKSLRKEVKEIQKEVKRDNGGIYLSVGAILVILLILILIL
jgi:DNA gyrase/topoisomerase IV subunit A